MSKALGLGVLALGTIALGLWGRADHAADIETKIAQAAAGLGAGSVHGISAQVSGRDITLNGLADTEAERAAIVAAAEALPGRRVVRAPDLAVLPQIAPYLSAVVKADGGALSASGHVPSEAARAAIAGVLGGAETALTLGAGAPADWAAKMQAGVAALGALNHGSATLEGDQLVIRGEATGPDDHIAMATALAVLPDSAWRDEVTLLDDGTPPNWTLDWSALSGGKLMGKLPLGVTPDAVQAALGLGALDAGDVALARIGTPGDTGLFGKLKGLLPGLETLRLTSVQSGLTAVAGLARGINLEAAQANLASTLGADVALSVETAEAGAEDGAERVNSATGLRERLSGGYWLAVPDLTPDVANCTAATDAILSESTINFLSGSADLDAESLAVLNRLGSIIRECAAVGGLKAEIGGHTDSSGNPEANRRLSQLRASAVRVALIERGAPRLALISKGYGDTVPVADNTTDEGKAKNRRTTIIWTQ